MTERENSPFGKEKSYKYFLGVDFFPFEDGLADGSDLRLPPSPDAVGYSPTFKIHGIGKGRIELFLDMKNLVPVENEPQADAFKYRGHKLIPTVAVPVIYYDDPENVETNLFCFMEYKDKFYYGENDWRYYSSDCAVFTQWESDEKMNTMLSFMTLDDLKQINVLFDVIDDSDSDYLISDDGFNSNNL